MKRTAVILLPLWALTLCACGGGGDDGRIAFELTLENLPILPLRGGTYQGWAVVGGVPLSTGKFRLDDSTSPPLVTNPIGSRIYGTTDKATFGPANTRLGDQFPFILSASSFFITVEPEGDQDLLPTDNVVLEGPIIGSSAMLSPTAFTSGDLGSAFGSGILTTPTDLAGPDRNGVWFVQAGTFAPALSLPPLSGTWSWEGWVSDGTSRWSTGKFVANDAPDRDASDFPGRGPDSVGFAAPGQDFRTPALVDFSEILELDSGAWRVEVTVEPSFDNDRGPFPLEVARADIPTDAVNTGKVSQRDVDLEAPLVPLPAYDVVIAPTVITLTTQVGSSGLGSLGPLRNGHYQLWVVLAGVETAVVRLQIDAAGQATDLGGTISFGTAQAIALDGVNVPGLPDLSAATEAFVTLELQGDPVPAASVNALLSGDLTAGSGLLDTGRAGLLGRGIADLSLVTGSFALRTPTDDLSGLPPNDQQGVWFVRFNDPFNVRTLVVPVLPLQWIFEGWVVNDTTGQRFSTGRFRDPANADLDAGTWVGRGTDRAGFPAPGQDFVTAVQPGTTIPVLDLNGGFTAGISIEPFPDSDPGPFLMVLEGAIPTAGTGPFGLNNLLPGNPAGTLPSGMLSFQDP